MFSPIDDFCLKFEPAWRNQLLASGQRRRDYAARTPKASPEKTQPERNHDYNSSISSFSCLVSYHRFIEWLPSTVIPLMTYLRSQLGTSTGIGFIDSTSLKVCHNRRIFCHRVFNGIAQRGKTSVDWFYGFKFHLAINDRGELLNIVLTAGNTDARKPVRQMLQGQLGKFIWR